MMKPETAQFKAVLFDMDGVIIDTKELVESFWHKKLQFHGVSIDDHYLETKVHGRPARLIIDELFSELPEEEKIEMDRECTEYDASQSRFQLVEGVEQILKQLIAGNITFGLVTSALPPKVEIMLNSLSCPDPFQAIVTANLVSSGKPDPECYLLGASKLGVPAKDVLVFEDSVSGVKAAEKAGSTVIGVNKPGVQKLLTDAGAAETIENFTKVNLIQTGAGYELTASGFRAKILSADD